VALKLQDYGIPNALPIEGGFAAWVSGGFPTEGIFAESVSTGELSEGLSTEEAG
jgi:hypothetical protein